jgi:hypothetical protein
MRNLSLGKSCLLRFLGDSKGLWVWLPGMESSSNRLGDVNGTIPPSLIMCSFTEPLAESFRNLKQTISKAKKAEIKKKKEEKEAERKKYTFMQRIQISRMKNM